MGARGELLLSLFIQSSFMVRIKAMKTPDKYQVNYKESALGPTESIG
jgi:hypothetical protein